MTRLYVRSRSGDFAKQILHIYSAVRGFEECDTDDAILTWGNTCCYVKKVKSGLSLCFWEDEATA